VLPTPIEAVLGVTTIELSIAGVTVNVADPLIVPEVAVMLADPCATPVASPAALTVANEVAEDVHETELVMFCEAPLL